MHPEKRYVSTLTPGPDGIFTSEINPVDGAKSRNVSSAFILHSIAHPFTFKSFCLNGISFPLAISICSFTRSRPETSYVTGCSTWSLAFISIK